MHATAVEHDVAVGPDAARRPRSTSAVRTDGVEADEVTLVLRRPLAELPPAVRTAISGWLLDHGVDPARVALDQPVRRDEASLSVSWREECEGALVVRHHFPPVDPKDRWPAPFPSGLVQ